jgi:hypothetical protein
MNYLWYVYEEAVTANWCLLKTRQQMWIPSRVRSFHPSIHPSIEKIFISEDVTKRFVCTAEPCRSCKVKCSSLLKCSMPATQESHRFNLSWTVSIPFTCLQPISERKKETGRRKQIKEVVSISLSFKKLPSSSMHNSSLSLCIRLHVH